MSWTCRAAAVLALAGACVWSPPVRASDAAGTPAQDAGVGSACLGLSPAEREAIEQDWRMQDGIGTERQAATYPAAIERTLERGGRLLADLRGAGAELGDLPERWRRLGEEFAALRQAEEKSKPEDTPKQTTLEGGTSQSKAQDTPKQTAPGGGAGEGKWEDLWRRVHWVRREVALANPPAGAGPLAFIKQVPGTFSHQLTQYYGRYARPGGGVFVLERPGRSLAARSLTAGDLPAGSYQHLDVSYDGRRVLFSYCEAPTPPGNTVQGHKGRYYHLYELRLEGSPTAVRWSKPRRLTEGDFDDFSPRYLPDGRILFISTRRGGWHRCGSPGCENYTLALAEADGSRPRPISFHETQEWDPAVLNDGRIVYTRWDYVDRHAVFYEQLWAVRPDGSNPVAFYGNNTFNPVGVWEPRAVPGSTRVMATAAAHHAMTAGSIILVDTAVGVDGPAPLARLTSDALFPEGECKVLPHWYAPSGPTPPAPVEQLRWPGHCYRSPYPLSESVFLAAYSYQPLVGEPKACSPNMFGLYLVDAHGNKELLHRDAELSSLWPMPLRPRPRPPVLSLEPEIAGKGSEGLFLLQDVYAADPPLPPGSVRALRVVQVLPKSTPGINNPPVGLPNASPGKQVLGTVPVEADGSAYFRAPAGLPLNFQALDERGQAIQIMRSVTYLQPGETTGCVGCHESRTTAPPRRSGVPLAMRRGASAIRPAPEGSRPLSFPLLVQPVLNKHCTGCHGGDKPKGGIDLTGKPDGPYTSSYTALAKRVRFSAWGGGNFRQANSEPLSQVDFFGARGSKVMKMLLGGHNKVALSQQDVERLATWMDANALFYGTFDRDDQARQKAGQRIAGPGLE
ncbi:MAG: WD40-like Beta Propeller Repeat protein [Planctomycetes bacterium ADurb.Bin126]|mgnify:CR=1 FL=1|nr:MAG: WD40-like Beta Propeller Repeat protein [Planctomycetes bacterium ADurb.Bin126]HOD84246.1 hypothetical protein [Phycisphaerae bacterium]HQL75447.1 hypothetical protein [Phycisphaerae bacterium]